MTHIAIDAPMSLDALTAIAKAAGDDIPVTICVIIGRQPWSATGHVTAYQSHRECSEGAVDELTGERELIVSRTIGWKVVLTGETPAEAHE